LIFLANAHTLNVHNPQLKNITHLQNHRHKR